MYPLKKWKYLQKYGLQQCELHPMLVLIANKDRHFLAIILTGIVELVAMIINQKKKKVTPKGIFL